MVEVEGAIIDQYILILVDLGAILSYISHKIIESYKIVAEKY